MRIIAEGRMATLLEVEQVIEWLEKRRLKLGGKARKYESKRVRKFKASLARSDRLYLKFSIEIDSKWPLWVTSGLKPEVPVQMLN